MVFHWWSDLRAIKGPVFPLVVTQTSEGSLPMRPYFSFASLFSTQSIYQWRYVFTVESLQGPHPLVDGFYSMMQYRKSMKKAEPMASSDVRPEHVTSIRTELGKGNLLHWLVQYCHLDYLHSCRYKDTNNRYQGYPNGPRISLDARLGMVNLGRLNGSRPSGNGRFDDVFYQWVMSLVTWFWSRDFGIPLGITRRPPG